MKITNNVTKDFLLSSIRFLNTQIIRCARNIKGYDNLIEKERKMLNNTYHDPSKLWEYRYLRDYNVKMKRLFQSEMKLYQKILSAKFES